MDYTNKTTEAEEENVVHSHLWLYQGFYCYNILGCTLHEWSRVRCVVCVGNFGVDVTDNEQPLEACE